MLNKGGAANVVVGGKAGFRGTTPVSAPFGRVLRRLRFSNESSAVPRLAETSLTVG